MIPEIEAEVEQAAKARGYVDGAFLQRWNARGRALERWVDGTLQHWSSSVLSDGAGWQTALACATEAASVFIPTTDLGTNNPGQRAVGALREGLKSALYARFVEDQRAGAFREAMQVAEDAAEEARSVLPGDSRWGRR